MPINRSAVLAACLVLALPARAEEMPEAVPDLPDVVYKGVVGKALDAVPMDPEERANLQRGSAVVSGTLGGRSLAVWAGVSNPILLIAGFVWGLYSASNIKAAESNPKPDADRVEPQAPVSPGPTQFALLTEPSAGDAK